MSTAGRVPHVPGPSSISAWPLLAATVLMVGGCSLFDDDQASPVSPTTTVPAVKVLDSGRAPRKVLRLHFVEGATTTLDLSLDLDVAQKGDGAPQALNSPVIRETVRFTTERVDGTEADISFLFTAASVDRTGTDLTGAEHLELTADLQQLVGLGGTGRVNDRGTFTAFGYDLPDGLDSDVTATLRQIEQQLTAVALPLPIEPLGVGARWRTTTTATLAGIALDQVTTYEITGLTDSGVSYRSTTRQQAAAQPIDPATMPAGTSARLVSAEVTGTGTGTMDLDSLAATSSSTLSGTQVVDLTRNKLRPVRLTQQLDLTITVAATG